MMVNFLQSMYLHLRLKLNLKQKMTVMFSLGGRAGGGWMGTKCHVWGGWVGTKYRVRGRLGGHQVSCVREGDWAQSVMCVVDG